MESLMVVHCIYLLTVQEKSNTFLIALAILYHTLVVIALMLV